MDEWASGYSIQCCRWIASVIDSFDGRKVQSPSISSSMSSAGEASFLCLGGFFKIAPGFVSFTCFWGCSVDFATAYLPRSASTQLAKMSQQEVAFPPFLLSKETLKRNNSTLSLGSEKSSGLCFEFGINVFTELIHLAYPAELKMDYLCAEQQPFCCLTLPLLWWQSFTSFQLAQLLVRGSNQFRYLQIKTRCLEANA